MSELFRFVSLRGPAPLQAATIPYVVYVTEPANADAVLSEGLDLLVEKAAAKGWLISLGNINRWLGETFDGLALADVATKDPRLLTARKQAEAIVSSVAGGAAESTPGLADRATAHVMMAEYVARVAALPAGDPFRTLAEDKQAAIPRDFFTRAVLVASSTTATPFTMKARAAPKQRRSSAPAASTESQALRTALGEVRAALAAVVAALVSDNYLDANTISAAVRAGLLQVMSSLPVGELAIIDRSSLEKLIADLEEHIRSLVAELADVGDYSEGQPVRGRKPTPTTAGDTAADQGGVVPIRLGVGDLMLTELQSTAYAYGDIAHIENILAGEHRERTYRKTSSTETEAFTLTESESTTETDSQSTQRFELEKASQSSLKETLNINAGASISGSYGPVTAQASFGVGSTTGRESSQNQATKLAQEVVSKASSKIRQLSSTQTRSITKIVVDDSTVHEVDNKGPGRTHIVGVYRWVNKLESLQLLDYGQRLMLELTVPEPGSYLRWLGANRDTIGGLSPPTVFKNGSLVPLGPLDVTPDNYLTWVVAYAVSDATPPPARFVTQATGLDSDPSASAEKPGYVTKTDTTLTVPAGYRAVLARGAVVAYNTMTTAFGAPVIWNVATQIAVGPASLALSVTNAAPQTFSTPLAIPSSETASGVATSAGAKIPIILNIASSHGYAVTIEVVFERTESGLATWRLETWAKIMAAYKAGADAAAEAQARSTLPGITIRGKNPTENRQIERAELKRCAIELLAGAVGSVDAVLDDDGKRPHPDRSKIAALEALTHEFEDTFEWEHMSWESLDYFWAPESSWDSLMAVSDTDNDHQAFLGAGAAKVTIPVRPGFETAVLFRLWTQRRWPGDRAPLPNVAAAVALGAEVATSAKGAPQRGVAVEGGAWVETAPTDLVILQPEGLLNWKPVTP